MAIVDMKRLLVAADSTQREALLMKLQQLGCVQVTPFADEVADLAVPAAQSDAELASAQQATDRLRWAITKLGKYDTQKTSMLAPRPEANVRQMSPAAAERQQMEALVDRVEALERRTGEIKGHETRLNSQIDQLTPWEGLDIQPGKLQQGRSWGQFLGTMSRGRLEQLMAEWADKPVYFEVVGRQQEAVYFWAVVYSGQAEALHMALKEREYTPAQFERFEGTVKQHRAQLKDELDTLSGERAKVEEEYAAIAAQLPALRVYHDALLTTLDRARAGQQLLHTNRAFLLRGWVPALVEQQVAADLKQAFPDAMVAISDPEEGDEPPVLLHNHPVIRPYEAVVTGFSLPAPGSIDPTAIMMPFFACFFGMMVSDAGYGLLMALLIPILVKVMKPTEGGRKLFWILGGGGIATVVWGALYNTWFGFGPWPTVFDPVNDSLPVMGLCVGLGALHLFTGLGVGAWRNIRDGKPLDAVYDQLSWMLLVIGLGLLALPATAAIGQWMAIAGAAIIIVTAGRANGNNPIKRLISGLGALYGVTGWISDLLSYMRLFGMGLATGVIGMVINQLVGMIFAAGPIGWVIGAVVFVGAHLFNAAINILGAYVHACRLQYIEFFGKFYEEGGKPFKPLRMAPRYVRLSE